MYNCTIFSRMTFEDNLKIKTNKGKETIWNCHRVCSLGKRNLVVAQSRYGNSVSLVLGSVLMPYITWELQHLWNRFGLLEIFMDTVECGSNQIAKQWMNYCISENVAELSWSSPIITSTNTVLKWPHNGETMAIGLYFSSRLFYWFHCRKKRSCSKEFNKVGY